MPNNNKKNIYLISIAKPTLSIRNKPSIKSKKIGKIPENELIRVINSTGKKEVINNKSGEWKKIEYNGIIGYVFDAFLKPQNTKRIIYKEKTTTIYIDGVILRSTISVFLPEEIYDILKGSTETRKTNYLSKSLLARNIREHIGGKQQYIRWSGHVSDTHNISTAINETVTKILIANKNGHNINLITHSMGTIIGYLALIKYNEMTKEKPLSAQGISNFVMLASPLSSKLAMGAIHEQNRKLGIPEAITEYKTKENLGITKNWINLYADNDKIGKGVDGIDILNLNIKFDGDFDTAHSLPYKDESSINVIVDLLKNKNAFSLKALLSIPHDDIIKNHTKSTLVRLYGKPIFDNNCASCHQKDGTGVIGKYPNLTDVAWLWGKNEKEILNTILSGRKGNMPAFKNVLTSKEITDVSHYVLKLSGEEYDSAKAVDGKHIFSTKDCSTCHLQSGLGQTALGSANLTDKIWTQANVQGSTSKKDKLTAIENVIANGIYREMPAWKTRLSKDEIKTLVTYVVLLGK